MPGGLWITAPDPSTARGKHASCGTPSAMLIGGGNDGTVNEVTSSEEFDGSSWSSGGNIISTEMYDCGSFGRVTAAVAAGGYREGAAYTTDSTEYNGTSWSAGNALPATHWAPVCCGVETAGVLWGNDSSSRYILEYDGTNWSNSVLPPTSLVDGSGFGTQTNALFAKTIYAYTYNGTTYASSTAFNNTAHNDGGSAGPSDSDGVVVSNDGTEGWNGTAWINGAYYYFQNSDSSASGNNVTNSALFHHYGAAGNNPRTAFYYGNPTELGNGISFSVGGYISGGTETSFDIYLTNATEADDLLFIVVNKDDDIPSGGAPSGWELVFGGNSGTGMYTEIFYKLATGSETTVSFTGLDSEEYAVGTFIIGGAQADNFAIDANTDSGTSVTQTVNIPEAEVGVSFFGFGADDGETPHTIDTTDTYADISVLIDSIVTTSGGSGSVSLSAGYAVENGSTPASAAWSSGGSLNTARYGLAGCGTRSAGLSFGGNTGTSSAVTEEYNGFSWSSENDLNTARRYLAGCGTQSAGLSFGGLITAVSAVTEEYDGSSWSSGGNLSTARQNLAGCGTQTAGLSFGGYVVAESAVTEEYNGSTWSTAGTMDLNTARYYLAGCGTQTAGLSFGGFTGSVSAVTEEYDGSTWSSGGNLNTARQYLAGCGTQSAGLSFGGTGPLADTEEYDGSTWSSGGDLNTARYALAGCGTQTAGLSFGGYIGGYLAVTEEYTGYDYYAASLTHTLNASDEWLAWSISVFAQVDAATGDIIFVYKTNPEFQQQMVTAATLGGILVE